jgi:hypothetical protein
LVKASDAAGSRGPYRRKGNRKRTGRRYIVFIVVQHTIKDAPTAFRLGQNLLEGRGAPSGVQVRKFYPSTDQSAVFCLWEGDSVDELREYVDTTLGDSSKNSYFEVDAQQAVGLPEPALARA